MSIIAPSDLAGNKHETATGTGTGTTWSQHQTADCSLEKVFS